MSELKCFADVMFGFADVIFSFRTPSLDAYTICSKFDYQEKVIARGI